MSNSHSLRQFFHLLGRAATRAPLAGQVLFTTHDRDAARQNSDLAALVDRGCAATSGDTALGSIRSRERPALTARASAC